MKKYKILLAREKLDIFIRLYEWYMASLQGLDPREFLEMIYVRENIEKLKDGLPPNHRKNFMKSIKSVDVQLHNRLKHGNFKNFIKLFSDLYFFNRRPKWSYLIFGK